MGSHGGLISRETTNLCVWLFSRNEGPRNSLCLAPTFQVHPMALGQVENIIPDSASHRDPLARPVYEHHVHPEDRGDADAAWTRARVPVESRLRAGKQDGAGGALTVRLRGRWGPGKPRGMRSGASSRPHPHSHVPGPLGAARFFLPRRARAWKTQLGEPRAAPCGHPPG